MSGKKRLHTQLNTSHSLRNRLLTGGVVAGAVAIAALFIVNIHPTQPSQSNTIRISGNDGIKTVHAAQTVLNTYAALAANASQGDESLWVNDISLLNGGDALTGGDLLLIIQMQGASVRVENSPNFGEITSYGSAGNYEFAGVGSVSGNQIFLNCGLLKSYSQSGHTQVIRVPQYSSLQIEAGASVTAPAWNGSTGGVVALLSGQTTLTGSVDVSGKGFRGGQTDNSTDYSRTEYYTSNQAYGAEKGEGIAGWTSEYSALGAIYGRGAIANGGGGGNAHNAGGGGGANGNNGDTWTGQGRMCSSCTGTSAWALDPGYITNGNALARSSGGGRGGYAFANQNQNALAIAPGNSAWGGNSRMEIGGLGARPLANDPSSHLFMGGGGGAGDGNNSAAAPGAAGGGMVFLVSSQVSGSGSIYANGNNGTPTVSGHNDGPGGGGAGGTVLVKAGQVSAINVYARGGNGGNQLITNAESEGPGGGGGGGYVSLPPASAALVTVIGGAGGTSTSTSVTEFPSNGATDGAAGSVGQTGYIPFCSETDNDLDGVPDTADLDDDNDGIPDWTEVGCSGAADWGTFTCPDLSERNSNGIPHYQDPAYCASGVLVNGVCPEYDSDADGFPDYMDLDSDGDGIPDITEAGGTDSDNDGRTDAYARRATSYTVALTVTDDDGAMGSHTKQIYVQDDPPFSRFTATPGTGSNWATVSFNASSSSDNGLITSYSWDFGDGSTASGISHTHTYSKAGAYQVRLSLTDNEGKQNDCTYSMYLSPSGCTQVTGTILREFWNGISGSAISDLTNNSAYPGNPTGSSVLTAFQSPASFGENYGTRIRGLLHPTLSGVYAFAISGDDNCALFLSTDDDPAHKLMIASVPGWTNPGELTRFTQQRSSGINLTAGKTYYIEALHKEAGGGDHVAVYWTTPTGSPDQLITGAYLSPYSAECINRQPLARISISSHAGNHPLTVTFNASGSTDTDGSIVNYTWDFGDGTSGSGGQVSHTFRAALVLQDQDNDGWSDNYDSFGHAGAGYGAGTSLSPPDTDGDGRYNFQDIDADGDGIPDLIEAQLSGRPGTLDGLTLPLGTDSDSDGLDDAFDTWNQYNESAGQGVALASPDTDADTAPDRIDSDSDNDSFGDILEGHDSDYNGSADRSPSGADTDNDGLDDIFDTQTLRSGAAFARTNPYTFNGAIQDANGNLNAGGERDWRESTSSTFPVEWLSFEARLEAADGLLEWVTASELNNDFFEIERSADGLSFEALGEVNGAGNSQEPSIYTFTDPQVGNMPLPSVTYRIRQVDMGGAFSYSKQVELKLGQSRTSGTLEVYPNPVTDAVINVKISGSGTWAIEVLSIQGQVLRNSQAGSNSEVRLALQGLASGTYLVRASQGGQVLSKKIEVR